MDRNRLHTSLHSQSGQAGLIVVLLSVVVLTIGLSLMIRTTQQAQITAQQEESAKIFSAAETGIEKALADIQSLEQNEVAIGTIASQSLTDPNASVNLSISQDNILKTHLDQGAAAEIAVNSTDPIDINWSFVTCSNNPAALIISIYNRDGLGNVTSRYEAVKGPENQGCTSGKNFHYSTVTTGDAPYQFKYQLSLVANDYFVRIEPVFNSTDIKAEGLSINRAQFTAISKAEDVTGSNQAKAIEVKRTLSTPPSFMDYTLYSGSSITK